MIRVIVHAEEFLRDLHELEASVVRGTKEALGAGLVAAAENAKATSLFADRTGKLRSSITVQQSADGEKGSVTAKARTASFIENGTRAHVIEAKAGGMLAFQVNGTWVFTRRVNHPGTKPRPFMALATIKGAEILTRELEKNIAKATEGFNA